MIFYVYSHLIYHLFTSNLNKIDSSLNVAILAFLPRMNSILDPLRCSIKNCQCFVLTVQLSFEVLSGCSERMFLEKAFPWWQIWTPSDNPSLLLVLFLLLRVLRGNDRPQKLLVGGLVEVVAVA